MICGLLVYQHCAKHKTDLKLWVAISSWVQMPIMWNSACKLQIGHKSTTHFCFIISMTQFFTVYPFWVDMFFYLPCNIRFRSWCYFQLASVIMGPSLWQRSPGHTNNKWPCNINALNVISSIVIFYIMTFICDWCGIALW